MSSFLAPETKHHYTAFDTQRHQVTAKRGQRHETREFEVGHVQTQVSSYRSHLRKLGGSVWNDRHFSKYISNGFSFELAAITFGIALTIALGIVLFAYDGRALPSWPWGITVCTEVVHFGIAYTNVRAS